MYLDNLEFLTMTNTRQVPVQTLHLFLILDKMLIDLLNSLSDDQWNLPTIARKWTVKDVVAHLVDGNLRNLSTSRDRFFVKQEMAFHSYTDLVNHLNQLNHEWTDAAKRLSPSILIDMLEVFGKQYVDHLHTLHPFEKAIYSVAWAGQDVSENWFHIAREYTERFIHQQQIRDSVGASGLMTKELFYPFIQTLMYGLIPTFHKVEAEEGTSFKIVIASEIGGSWIIEKKDQGWIFNQDLKKELDVTLIIQPDIAWKLFSKGMTPVEAFPFVEIMGDVELASNALNMVSVMA